MRVLGTQIDVIQYADGLFDFHMPYSCIRVFASEYSQLRITADWKKYKKMLLSRPSSVALAQILAASSDDVGQDALPLCTLCCAYS